jgi:hypothetical protein
MLLEMKVRSGSATPNIALQLIFGRRTNLYFAQKRTSFEMRLNRALCLLSKHRLTTWRRFESIAIDRLLTVALQPKAHTVGGLQTVAIRALHHAIAKLPPRVNTSLEEFKFTD